MENYDLIQEKYQVEKVQLDEKVISDEFNKYFDIIESFKNSKTTPNENVNYDQELVYVDPGTVKTIISIGIKIYDLFSQDEDPNQNIGYWLKLIQNDLRDINTKLTQVLEILKELEIKLNNAFRMDVELELLGNIMSYTEHIEDFNQRGDDENIYGLMVGIYKDIKTKRGQLMGYGYAGAHTIALALRAEIDLIKLLGYSNTTLRNCLYNYDVYFSNCIGDTSSGSFLFEIDNIHKDLNSIAQNWQPGHKGSIRFSPYDVHEGALFYQENPRNVCQARGRDRGPGTCVSVYDRWRWYPGFIAEGDLINGFILKGTHEEAPGYFKRYMDHGTRAHTYQSLSAGMVAANQIIQEKIKPIFDKATIKYRDTLVNYNCILEALKGIKKIKSITAKKLGSF